MNICIYSSPNSWSPLDAIHRTSSTDAICWRHPRMPSAAVIYGCHPACKWKRRGKKQPSIACDYRGGVGVWRTHCQTPAFAAEDDVFRAIVRECEQRVQEFYGRSHVTDYEAAEAAEGHFEAAEGHSEAVEVDDLD